MSTSSSSSSTATLLAAAGVAAAALGVTLTALQSDAVSRKWLLSPEKLAAKRSTEYLYRWNKALGRAVIRMSWNLQTGSSSVQDEELLQTQLLSTPDEIAAFCEKLVSNKHKDEFRDLRVIRIGKDDRIETNSNEHYVWLVVSSQERYQLPLSPFCTALEQQLQRKIITATFCFVADASAQQGGQMIADLIQAVENSSDGDDDDKTKEPSVLIVQQPVWMCCLAAICEQGVYSTETLQRMAFCLVRLEAIRASRSCTTVLFTLPGQSVVKQLLPLLQAAFPDDRHVFCYTGCINTVETALQTRHGTDYKSTTQMPTSWPQALCWTDPVVYTTPLGLFRSVHLMSPYTKTLAALPVQHADTVQSWMSAVDAFFLLKHADKKNGYLPYVCKIDYLLGGLDTSGEIAAAGNPSFWALRSLLQFVTGTKSREMPTDKMDTAVQWLRNYSSKHSLASLSSATKLQVDPKAIENTVFEHKLILIENKTFLDTVQPAEHWTLKAAVKRGCACCAPEDEEEEEEEEEAAKNNATKLKTSSLSMPGAFATSGMTRRKPPTSSGAKNGGYVDGKTTFAFDPTKFS